LPWTAGAGVFPGIYLKVWDSQSHPRQCNCTASENELKFLKSIRQPLFSSFGKSEDQRWILPLMGCQCMEKVKRASVFDVLDSRRNFPGAPRICLQVIHIVD